MDEWTIGSLFFPQTPDPQAWLALWVHRLAIERKADSGVILGYWRRRAQSERIESVTEGLKPYYLIGTSSGGISRLFEPIARRTARTPEIRRASREFSCCSSELFSIHATGTWTNEYTITQICTSHVRLYIQGSVERRKNTRAQNKYKTLNLSI